MKKNFTLLAIMASVITILSGCSSEHFERATVASTTSSTASEIKLQPEIEIPQSSTVEIPPADTSVKETPSETQNKKEEEVSLPEVFESKKPESDTSSLPEADTENDFDTDTDNKGNVTQKPEVELKPESEVPLKPQATPEVKPGSISESDIADFYPDNFNCEELAIGETHKPSASVWLNGGKGKAYSSDESVAVVSSSGVVTAKGKGTAYIKIIASTGMSKVYRYTVNECGITEDDIQGFYPDAFNTFELAIGETHKPSASIWLTNGNGKVYSSDESVVTVNASGVVTAKGKGTAYIKIVGSTGMSETYMYTVDSNDVPHNNFFTL